MEFVVWPELDVPTRARAWIRTGGVLQIRAYRTRKKGLPSPLPAVGRGGEGQLWLF